MKYGRELEEAIVEFITNNQDKPGHGLERHEVVSFFARYPGETRTVEQALARLVKKSELVEDRGREPNGIPTYLLPGEVVRLDELVNDPAYQKRLDANFHMGLVGKITVRVEPNGSKVLLDGQHRVAAAKALGFETLPYKQNVEGHDEEETP